MPIKIYRPVTKGRRISSVQDTSDVTRKTPEKSLTIARKEFAGRTKGKITVRHKGGGARQRVRIVDFRRDKHDIPARVDSIEYDPNRGARVSLLVYRDGEKRYMLT
ncbi:50S ribosomal protein L2, partial [Candidatus Uhrbacteria bacterium]|nr:50S ribosomal protein L2 [Candidatus Uhrbacteria bacterium]